MSGDSAAVEVVLVSDDEDDVVAVRGAGDISVITPKARSRPKFAPHDDFDFPSKAKAVLLYLKTFKSPFVRRDDSYIRSTLIGEGSFGEVFKGTRRTSTAQVAVKRMKLGIMQAHNGIPACYYREIMVMEQLNEEEHTADLMDFVANTQGIPPDFSVILRYCDYDLCAILNSGVLLTLIQKKTIFLQLLQALHSCHKRGIMHRDLKTSNILIDKNGMLKLTDFGMARNLSDRCTAHSPTVCTLWYRAPEVLLGFTDYGCAVDMWSAGCLLAEFLKRKPFMPGNTEQKQLELIIAKCGTIDEVSFPGCSKSQIYSQLCLNKIGTNTIQQYYRMAGVEAIALLEGLLKIDPRARLTAKEALEHSYFNMTPLPAENIKELLTTIPNDGHFEYEVRMKRARVDSLK